MNIKSIHGLGLEKQPVFYRTRGFSLIELLVVFAMALILASLFYPAIQKQVSYSKNILCQNNLKSIGYATDLYVSDYQNKYPPGYQYPSIFWQLTLAIYYDENILGYADLREKGEWIFFCPEDKVVNRWNVWDSYIANSMIMQWWTSVDIDRVQNPQRTLLVADGPYALGISINSGLEIFERRHFDEGNILWADYHVGSEFQLKNEFVSLD